MTRDLGPWFFRDWRAGVRHAERIADTFGCRVVTRFKDIGGEDHRALYGIWREDTELTEHEEDQYKKRGWYVESVIDARHYNDDGTLRREHG